MKYLKEFIIGSSPFVVFPYYYFVITYKRNKNYTFEQYAFGAPLWFGIWNIISLILAERFNLSTRMRFILVTLLSYISILSIVYAFNVYKFDIKQWIRYSLIQLVRYIIVWNIVIFYLHKYI